jgi:serine protease Do
MTPETPETPEPLGPALAELATTLRRSTVEVRTGVAGAGSGIIWTAGGVIITNAHVARADAVTVVLWDGRELAGEVTARDRRRDLAMVALHDFPVGDGLPAATIGNPSALRPGDLLVALGSPLGIAGALALGIVHAIDPGRAGAPRWIRADIRLAPGNSGGPLADARGRVVGVNTMIAGGLGVAVPVTTIARFLGETGFDRGTAGWRAA